jgi:hypothetical protein
MSGAPIGYYFPVIPILFFTGSMVIGYVAGELKQVNLRQRRYEQNVSLYDHDPLHMLKRIARKK